MLASNLKFSAGMKLDVNKKIGWLLFSIQSFLWTRRAQSGSGLQRRWSLFEPQARDLFDAWDFYSNYYIGDYQLNFRELFDGGELNSLFGFQI